MPIRTDSLHVAETNTTSWGKAMVNQNKSNETFHTSLDHTEGIQSDTFCSIPGKY